MPEGTAGTGNPLLDLLLVLILILVGGVFAAAEIALLTVRRHRLDQLAEEGSRGARVAQRLINDPQRFLATIQVAITFLGFLASAIGAIAFSQSIAQLISGIPWEPIRSAAETIAFLLVTLLIALTSIIVGELVPKTLALNFPERFSLIASRPLSVLERSLAPLVWLTTTISGFLVRMLGGRERPQTGLLSVEELKLLVQTGSEQGQIEEAEKEMIHGVIELGDKRVHEVMVPRIGIKAVEADEPIETDGDRRAYRLDGRVTMDDLRDLFELGDAEEPDEEAYDTVGGLIIHRVGRIPLVGTEINYRDVTLRVQAADSRRVSKVMAVQMLESPAPVENSSR